MLLLLLLLFPSPSCTQTFFFCSLSVTGCFLLPFLLLLLLLLLLLMSFLLLKPFPSLSFRPETKKFHLHNAELQKHGIVWKIFSDCGSKPAVEPLFFLCTPTPLAFVAHFLVHLHPPPRELSRAQAIAGPPLSFFLSFSLSLSLSLSLSSVTKSVRVKEEALLTSGPKNLLNQSQTRNFTLYGSLNFLPHKGHHPTSVNKPHLN